MKILICTTEFPPNASGIGNVVAFVKDAFIEKGHECIICSPYGPDITVDSKRFVPKRIWFSSIKIIYFWYNVSKYFSNKHLEYDTIWLHQPLFVLKKSPFNKSLITIHTTYAGKSDGKIQHTILSKVYYKIMKRIEKYSFSRMNIDCRYTYIDNKILKELSHIGIQSHCTFISNGVNSKKFTNDNDKNNIRKQLDISLDHKVFISVGRIVKVKRPFLMLDIFKKLQQNHPKTTLIIVGDGNILNGLKKYANTNKINNIKFMGFVSHDYLPSLYSCADYYIMTSEYEGLPLTLLEAMASGLPCIVPNIPNFHIVNEANCGIVIDFTDSEKATYEILGYVKGFNKEHAENARRYIENNLDWKIIADKYLEEFHEMN